MFAKRATHWLSTLSFALLAQTALASPTWQLNPEGSGASSAVPLTALSVGGVGFVQIIPDGSNPTQFTFLEHGAYQAVQSDGATPFGTRDLTITYSVSGSGSFLNPGALQFTSGSIKLFADGIFDFASTNANYGADNGTAVANFTVTGGEQEASGLVTVRAALIAGSLLPGYLFAADGSDLVDTGNVALNLGIFNQPTNPDSILVSEIVCGLSGYGGAGCNGMPFTNSPLAFAVRDGGFASITAVPEPGALGLSATGLGLLLLTGRRRSTLRAARS